MFEDSKILSPWVIPVGVTAVSVVVLTRYFGSRGSPNRSTLPYPPGPKGLPLIGNMLDLPRDTPIWEGFAQIAETHRTSMVSTGEFTIMSPCVETDVVHLNVFGTDIVVLNSSEAIADLLDKKSVTYSDRVILHTALSRSASNVAAYFFPASITVSRTDGRRQVGIRVI